VDRLTVLKALADDSRYAIFSELARAERPLSTIELAGRLELHPNTVRLHLERLRGAGMVSSATQSHGAVGRPQVLWSLAPDAPSLGLEPDGFRVLAHLLADALAASAPRPAALVAIGRRAGEARVGATGLGRSPRRRRRARTSAAPTASATARGSRLPTTGSDPGRAGAGGWATVAPGELADWDLVAAEALEAVRSELADLGFDPQLEIAPAVGASDRASDRAGASDRVGDTGSLGASVLFTSCPFRELATSYPDLVCALHRGVTEGIVAAVVSRRQGASASVVAFSTLVDPDPCRAEVALRPAGRPGAPTRATSGAG